MIIFSLPKNPDSPVDWGFVGHAGMEQMLIH